MPRRATLLWIVATLGALFVLIALDVPAWLRYVAIVAWSLVWWRYRWVSGGRERYQEAARIGRERRRKRQDDGGSDNGD
jgi:hypothetical protein